MYRFIALCASVVLAGCITKPLPVNSEFDEKYSVSSDLLTEDTRFHIDGNAPAYEVELKVSDYEVISQTSKSVQISTPQFRTDGNGYPILMIPQQFTQAWEQLNEAIERSRLTAKDRDRTAGLITLAAITGKQLDGLPMEALKSVYQLAISKTEQGIEISVQFSEDALPEVDSCQIILDEVLANYNS